MAEYTRRDVLKLAGAAAAGAVLLSACGRRPVEQPPASLEQRASAPPAAAGGAPGARLAIAHGADAAAITAAAVDALGGMKRFVKPGADVIVKPNICTDYHGPEYASTTNPAVVATLVSLALKAGAKRVRVMDNPFGGPPESAYENSGIATAVEAAGGAMEVMSPVKYGRYAIPHGKSISAWDVYDDVLSCDTLINVPIAKTHGSAVLTLGGKNLMGVILSPGQFHTDLAQRIADLTSLVRPQLTVVDAVRILARGGPTGGDLADVVRKDTVVASHDIVAADAWSTSLFGLRPHDVPYIPAMAALGLGSMTVPADDTATIRL